MATLNKKEVLKNYLLTEANSLISAISQKEPDEIIYLDQFSWCLRIFEKLLSWKEFMELITELSPLYSEYENLVKISIKDGFIGTSKGDSLVETMIDLYSEIPPNTPNWIGNFFKDEFNEIVKTIKPSDPPDWFFKLLKLERSVIDSEHFRSKAFDIYNIL